MASSHPSTPHGKLSVLEKIGFGAGDMSVNVVISSAFLIITYFYTDIFGLKASDVGIMLLAVRLIDAVADPLMGLITDRYNSRWGRYRPYFLFLSIPFGISIFLTFVTPEFGYDGKLAWAYATYTLMNLLFTGVTIPYISLVGVLTDSPAERLSANGYRLFFAKVAAFLVSIVVPVMALRLGNGDLRVGYKLAMGVMGAVATLLFLFCFFSTKERLQHKVERLPLGAQFKLLMRNDQWLVLCGVCIIGTLGYTVRNSVAAYYAKYYLGGSEELIAKFMGTGVVAALLAMIVSTWLTKSICKIAMFRWTQLAVGLLSAAMYFLIKPGDTALAFVLYFLLSLVVDLHAPVFWSAIAEAVDYGEKKTGTRVSGLAWGGISFCQKAGMGLAGALVGWLLTHFQYTPGQAQSAYSLQGIALMLSLISGAFHVGMGLLMFRYRITDKFYARMMKEGKI